MQTNRAQQNYNGYPPTGMNHGNTDRTLLSAVTAFETEIERPCERWDCRLSTERVLFECQKFDSFPLAVYYSTRSSRRSDADNYYTR